MENKKYIVTFQNGNTVLNATSKAPSDVATFLESYGFHRFDVATMGKGSSLCGLLAAGWKLLNTIKFGSVVTVQYPVYSQKGMLLLRCIRPLLKGIKRVKFIALIHDIRYMRSEPISMKEEVRELNRYSAIIVHSSNMGEQLKRDGCQVPYSVLGLFDYSVEKANGIERHLSKEICYAGNLVQTHFLKDLSSVCTNGVTFKLYGRPAVETSEGVQYCGAFKASDVSCLEGSWGLVWNGDSVDSLHTAAGEYQRYNSPHKASLFVVAGMPLIVNSEAAIAAVVRSRGIGICVDSLRDLGSAMDNVSEAAYNDMLENLRKYSVVLMNGGNVFRATGELINIVG